MAIRDEYCNACGGWFVLSHECPADVQEKIDAAQKRINILEAAIETVLYQKQSMQYLVSREQIRCWNIRLQNLRSKLKALRK
jgi:hypothetical protein